MDEQIDEAQKADVETNNIPESPAEETKLSEVEPVVEETEIETEESTPEPETKDKKSASYRIKELNEEKKAAEVRAQSLEDKLAELTGRSPDSGQPQYIPQVPEQSAKTQVDEYGNIDPVKYKEEILRDAQNSIDLQLARERNLNRINDEAHKVIQKYPQLNPDSEEFDKDLSDTVSMAAEGYLKGSPTSSVTKFVADMMKPYLRSIDNEVGKQREEITKQASQSALRPTQVPKGEKPFGELSLSEMEAYLGGVKK